MKPTTLKPHASHGMTLVEVLAVVIILGMLAATLVVSIAPSFGAAKSELARTGIGQIVQKVEVYRMEKSEWPTMELGLKVLSDGYATPAEAWYLASDKLLDPWNRSYYYVTPGPELHPYEVVSYGADGERGGDGENADISSVSLRAVKK